MTLEQDLVQKEQQLQDALNRQQELAERVRILRSKEMHIKEENERLVRSKVTFCHINIMFSVDPCRKQNFKHSLNRQK
jgi:hypothetical protein